MYEPQKRSALSNRFRILVCIDGSPASYQGLRYAFKFDVDHEDTDITLLQVRLRNGSEPEERLDVDLSCEDNPDLALDLPELASLKKARDVIVERGFLGEDWHSEAGDRPTHGRRRGKDTISFTWERQGQRISMMVRLATSVLAGILEAASEAPYDLVVVSTGDDEGGRPGRIDLPTAVAVATEHTGPVILARALEEGHGHMVCVAEAETSRRLALKDAAIAARCGCPIHLYAVTGSDGARDAARERVETVRDALHAEGYEIADLSVEVGDPVDRIIEHGRQHSLIVMAATEKSLLKRMFIGSVSHDVLRKAHNSVMIIR